MTVFSISFLDLLDTQGLTEMAEYSLEVDHEAGRSPLAPDADSDETIERTRNMLGTMVPLLLKACICGTVAALAERRGSDVRKELSTIASREEMTPDTYANFFYLPLRHGLDACSTTCRRHEYEALSGLNPSPADLTWIWRIDHYLSLKPDCAIAARQPRFTDWRPHDPKNPDKPFKRDDNRRMVLFHFVKEVEKMIALSENAGRLACPMFKALSQRSDTPKRPRHRLQHHAIEAHPI